MRGSTARAALAEAVSLHPYRVRAAAVVCRIRMLRQCFGSVGARRDVGATVRYPLVWLSAMQACLPRLCFRSSSVGLRMIMLTLRLPFVGGQLDRAGLQSAADAAQKELAVSIPCFFYASGLDKR